MNRSLQSGTPAYLTWNGITLQMEDDWDANIPEDWFDIKSHLQGYLDRGLGNIMGKITCRPIAFASTFSTIVSKLYPYATTKRGTFVFDNTDKPAVIQTVDGKSYTFAAAALTKSPSVRFDPDKPTFGEMELTCLLANNADLGSAACFMTAASSSYTEPTMTPLDLIRDTFSLSYTDPTGASVFDSIEVGEGGIEFTPTLTFAERKKKTLTYNMMLDGQTAQVKFRPENVTGAEFFSTIGATETSGLRLGKRIAELGRRLIVRGSASGMPILTLPAAYPTAPGGLRLGLESLTNEVTMEASRKYTTTTASGGSTVTSASTTVTIAAGVGGLATGMAVSGTGIAGGSTISSILSETQVVLSAAATVTGTPVLTITGIHPLYTLTTRSS